ncbi:acylneuraminate cytidylyltransferase [Christiangramia fulva]|uniref:Acylneuraminate cytidylyltransferase n=1 Tax=Christiangramia fulva TaxID=2126553 RepID=A0A2R3Z9G9_9FLAO|nr:acylneuraminate cytidylyltransferase [Christiangramia fulva]AVR46890.1 acylneuraminate cytidylyltransferase [Christiangramia fulva]
MSLALFIPVRKGSERVKEKNTRKFSDIPGGLLELKLNQLLKITSFTEIIISTNDPQCIEIAEGFKEKLSSLKIVQRPEELSSSETKLTDLIKYIPQITQCEHILWSHVTSPFCQAENYRDAIEKFRNLENHDSLMSVECKKEFFWDRKKKRLANAKGNQVWPRSQDLEEIYQVNSAIFLASRKFYENGNRIGKDPFLYEMNKLDSWDIDTDLDFKLAEAIYEKFYR